MTESNIEKLISDYLDSIYVISHSQALVDCYKSGLNHFKKFVQSKYEKPLEEILTLMKDDSIDRYKIFQEYVIYLDKEGKNPSSIKIFVIAPKGFVKFCGIKLYNEDFKMTVKLPKRIRQREEPLTKEIILRLLNNVSAKLRTIILVTSSSGMRIGETTQLKLSDIDFDSKPTMIRIRGITTKTRESRETFLTTEATNSLKDYLTRYFGWTENEPNNLQDLVIFGRTSKSRKSIDERKTTFQKSNSSVLTNSLRRHIENIPELSKLNENGRLMVHFHAFRKYFRTVVGNAVGRDFAEALMGHHFYLDTYYNLSEDKKREMYLQAEPLLTISDYTQIEKDLRNTKQKQKQIEERYLELTELIQQHHLEFPNKLEKMVIVKALDI